MAAPSGITWGSVVGDYGRIGIYVKFTDTATTRKVDIQVWFKSKYSVSDSSNNFYYNRKLESGAATTKRTISAIKTTVATGSGWSTSNEVKLWSDSCTYTLGTSSSTIYLAAKLADVDRVGGTMYVEKSFTVPALAKYTITYNANGGTGAPSAQTKYYGKNLTLSSTKPTRTGYSFQGWALTDADADAGKYYYKAGGTCGKNENLTLYAVWKANTYSVKFDANGGSGAPSAQTKTYGVTLKLLSIKPTRTNYNFLGWSTSKTATTATYSAGGNYTTNSGTTLYAVWELAYVRPRITDLEVYRYSVVDDRYVIDEQSTTAIVKFYYECDRAASALAIEWSSASGDSGSKSYQDLQPSERLTILLGDNFDVDTTYTIRVTVTDELGYSSVVATLNGVKLLIDVLPENAGISFGKPAELKDHADFNYTIYPRKGFKNVPIEEDTDLNTLIIPNTYVSQDKVASTYINCPVSGGTFKMEVASGGMEGQIHQTLTYTSKTDFKIYHRQYHSGSWPTDSQGNFIWNCIYSVAGNMLWDGSSLDTKGYYMTAGHTCNLSQKISEQPNGIVLVFSRFDSESNKGVNEQIVEYMIYKKTVNLLPGNGHSVPLLTPFANAVKYLYIHDSSIVGHEKNNQTITVGGITYTNNYFVLRYIIGF